MELFGESSDDDDDEEEDDAHKKLQAAAASAAKKKADNDDDDDDEGAAEFDDAAVDGSSSKAGSNKPTADAMDTTEDDAPPVPSKPPPKVVHQANLKVPASTLLSPNVSVHVTKLPNLMGIQTQAFDKRTYLPSAEDDEFGPMAASLARWRYADPEEKEEGAELESNTRLVEWEDGSWTLHIGTEAFEVEFKDRSKNNFAGFNGYLFQSHQAQVDEQENSATVLECVAPVASRLTVHPSSLQSAAHKSLTVAVRQKTLKQARIATLATQDDPELVKAERVRAAQDIHKQQRKSGGGRMGGGGGGGGRRRPRMSRGYMEDDDDDAYDTTNLRGMKRQVREGEDLGDFIDDDEDDGRTFRSKRSRRQQEPEEEDEDEEEELVLDDDDDDDDEEEEAAPLVKKKGNDKKPAHRNVFDDDDDDE